MNRHIAPKDENYEDAALLEGAASALQVLSLDLEKQANKGQTLYAEDAFKEALALISEAVSTLSSAATQANENAYADAADDLADRLYDERKDD